MARSESEQEGRRPTRRSRHTVDESGEAGQPPEVTAGVIARLLLLATIVVVPWIFGGAECARWLWPSALLGLLCWTLAPEARATAVSLPILFAPLALGAVYGAIQLVPIPIEALKRTSPKTAELWQLSDEVLAKCGAEAATAVGVAAEAVRPSTAHPLSLYPAATENALSVYLLCVAFFLLGSRFFRNRAPFVWLCWATAVNSGLLAVVGILDLVNKFRIQWWSGSEVAATFGPYLHRPEAVGTLLLGVAAATGLLGNAWARKSAEEASPRRGIGLIAMILVGPSAVGLWMLGSPLAAICIGIAAAVAFMAAFAARVRFGAVVVVLLVAGGAYFWFSGRVEKPKALESLASGAAADRQFLFNSPFRYGSGWGTAGLIDPTIDAAFADRRNRAESEYTRVFAEGGFLSSALLAVAFALQLAVVFSLLRRDARDVGVTFALPGVLLTISAVLLAALPPFVSVTTAFVPFCLWLGALSGRAVLAGQAERRSRLSFVPPMGIPAQAIGVLLISVGFWCAAASWKYETVAGALRKTSAVAVNRRSKDEVGEAIEQLRRLPHEGSAEAHYLLAERYIDYFRLQTADVIAAAFKTSPESVWESTSLGEISLQAQRAALAKRPADAELVRKDEAARVLLRPAQQQLRDAVAATPLASDAAVLLAELSFLDGQYAAPEAPLRLAEMETTDSEVLYRIGLLDLVADRRDKAAENFARSLRLSLKRVGRISQLIAPKFGVKTCVEKILPSEPEALLSFGEEVLGGRPAVERIFVVESVENLLKTRQFPEGEAAFYRARVQVLLDQWPKAEIELRRAVAADPKVLRWRHALVMCLELQGKRAEALAEAKKCLADEPANAAFVATVARLEKPTPPKEEKPAPPKEDKRKQTEKEKK